MSLSLRLLLLSMISAEISGARILGIYPMASISHQVVFRALTVELVKRGHELVVATPNPAFPKDRPKDNITEIDTSDAYELMEMLVAQANRKRGVFVKSDDTTAEEYQVMLMFQQKVLEKQDFRAVLEDPNQKFDLIIGEAIYLFPLSLAEKFNASVIWFSSLYGSPHSYAAMGAPTRHPLLHPSRFRSRVFNLSIYEKIVQIYKEWKMWYEMNKFMEIEANIVKDYLGVDKLSVNELLDKVDLLFVNANPVFEGNRPVPPSVIYLGAIHLKPVKELPQDLKAYLDSSKRGVIYMSLGTNVRFAAMDQDLVETFLDAVEGLPYEVLWKFDGTHLPRLPKNAKIGKWFPQRDLLHHPNIKAFITQGGLQSADETIDAGVPVVVIPIVGDQWFNAEQYVRLGVGVQLDLLTLQAKDIIEGVNTVVEDESYRSNMMKLSVIMRDQMQTPLERAVWWTEYVIRHGGAKHLRSAAANVDLKTYFMLDVLVSVVSVVLIVIFLLGLVVMSLAKYVCASKRRIRKDKHN